MSPRIEVKSSAPGLCGHGQESTESAALVANLTEFSLRAGHDMVGPLNQASSLLALFVKRYRSELDPEADSLLEFLQSAASRMEGVVSGVRKYMDCAGAATSIAIVDLNVSLAAALTRLAPAISASNAIVEADPLPSVTADPDRMAAIFEILIGNAIKFQKPELAPRVRISAHPEGDLLEITITDNGIGIEEEYREPALLPFKRLNGREYPGAGLGLPMAKLIAERHGGRLHIGATAENDPEAGTSVRFTVPRA